MSDEIDPIGGVDATLSALDQSIQSSETKVRMRIPLDSKAPLIAGIVLVIGSIPGLLNLFDFLSIKGLAFSILSGPFTVIPTISAVVIGVILLVFAAIRRFVSVIGTVLVERPA